MPRISIAIECPDEAAAEQMMDKVEGEYPSYGYGTSLRAELNEDGSYTVLGYRYDSCE